MNLFIIALIVIFVYILLNYSTEEGYQNAGGQSTSQQATLETDVSQNSTNIANLQSQVASMQSMINDISGNLSTVTDEVNSIQTQQATVVASNSPSNITGT
jgi:septal ring factor EnvC (AmiA/AmiB activator)